LHGKRIAASAHLRVANPDAVDDTGLPFSDLPAALSRHARHFS
jgi:hypothetical protein